jgi:hypothetical protein
MRAIEVDVAVTRMTSRRMEKQGGYGYRCTPSQLYIVTLLEHGCKLYI